MAINSAHLIDLWQLILHTKLPGAVNLVQLSV